MCVSANPSGHRVTRSHPLYCAAILGSLVKGLEADHVVWGTDSVWYGSPATPAPGRDRCSLSWVFLSACPLLMEAGMR